MSEWFKDWFASEEYLNVYQHRNNDDATKLLKLILENTQLQKGSKILDAACGAGRHSINLSAQGFRVTGFDLSRTLLKKAKSESNEKSHPVNLFCADLRKVSLREKYHLVINLFTSFGYFETDEENFLFPKIAFELLEKEGYYILDYFNKDFITKSLIPITIKKDGSKEITEKRRIDNNRVVKEIIIKDNNVDSRFTESVRLYCKEEIINNFKNIGFDVYKIFGDYYGNIFESATSQRLILFFKK